MLLLLSSECAISGVFSQVDRQKMYVYSKKIQAFNIGELPHDGCTSNNTSSLEFYSGMHVCCGEVFFGNAGRDAL